MSNELTTELTSHGNRGLVLSSMEEMWRFATCLAKSGLAPKGVDKPEAILIALQMGAELGLSPMASVQNVAVINGRPSLWGDALLAVCQASNSFDHETFSEAITEDVKNGLTAICTVRRLPAGKPITRTFSMDDAKKASLAGKTGPWSQYPRRMLQMRARSWALRDAFADLLRGFVAAEEAQDMPPLDRVIDATEIRRKLGGPTVKKTDEKAPGTHHEAPKQPTATKQPNPDADPIEEAFELKTGGK